MSKVIKIIDRKRKGRFLTPTKNGYNDSMNGPQNFGNGWEAVIRYCSHFPDEWELIFSKPFKKEDWL